MNCSPSPGFAVKTLSNAIKRHLDRSFISQKEDGDFPTGVQGYIIGYLYHRQDQDVFQRDIEKECVIRRSTATGILNRMEEGGWLKRRPVDYDARLKKIVLTNKAREAHRIIHAQLKELDTLLMQGIAPEDLACFYRVADQMQQNLAAAGTACPTACKTAFDQGGPNE